MSTKVEIKKRTPNFAALITIDGKEDKELAESYVTTVCSFDSSYTSYDVIPDREAIRIVFHFDKGSTISSTDINFLYAVNLRKFSGFEIAMDKGLFTIEFMRYTTNRTITIFRKDKIVIEDENNIQTLHTSSSRKATPRHYNEIATALKKSKIERH